MAGLRSLFSQQTAAGRSRIRVRLVVREARWANGNEHFEKTLRRQIGRRVHVYDDERDKDLVLRNSSVGCSRGITRARNQTRGKPPPHPNALARTDMDDPIFTCDSRRLYTQSLRTTSAFILAPLLLQWRYICPRHFQTPSGAIFCSAVISTRKIRVRSWSLRLDL